jgi:hypothetical protein
MASLSLEILTWIFLELNYCRILAARSHEGEWHVSDSESNVEYQ